MKAKTGSIAWRLAVAALLLNLFVVTMMAVKALRDEAHYHAHARVSAENLAKALEENFAGALGRIDLTLRATADEIRHQMQTTGAIDDARLQTVLGEQIARLPEAVGLQVANADGDIEHIANKARATKTNIADREHFIRTREPNSGLVIGKPVLGRVSGRWVFIVARRLENLDGSFAGQVQASVEVERMARILSELDLGADGSASLWNGEPSIITRYSARTQKVGETGSTTASQQFRDFVASGERAMSSRLATRLDNVTRQLAYRRIGDHPLFVVVGLAENNYLAPWRRDIRDMALMAVLFAAVTILGAWFVHRGWRRLEESEERRRLAMEEAEEARRRADLILASAGEGICGVDVDGVIAFINPAAGRMLGFAPDEGIGLSLHATTHHHHADGSKYLPGDCPVHGTLQDGSSRQIKDDVFWRRDGTSFPVEFTVAALAEDGQTEGAVIVFHDVTERHRQEALVRALLDAAPDAVFLIDPEGRLLATNGVLPRRFGKTPDELLGLNIFDLFPPEVAATRRSQLGQVLERREPAIFTDQRQGRHFENHIHPMLGPDGRIERIAVFSRDVTDGVMSQQRIEAALDEARRSNADLQQFAYAISHDLQEPLRTITAYLQLLERTYRGKLNADADEFIGFAVDGSKRMQAQIRDLLDYSRVDSRGREFTPVSLDQALDEAAENLGKALDDSGASVVRDSLPDVMGDSPQLVRLFQNLIGNAIKYRKEDTVPQVRVSALRAGDTWTLAVRDNGIGIEPKHFERIFQIFQRLHSREEYEGTGVGLAICRKIVERHGGRIWVESIPGEGSAFLFTLPALPGT